MPPLERFALLVALAVSSLAALLLGTRVFGLPRATLGRAVARMLEALGLGVGFFAVNVVAGTAFIIVTRMLTGWFVSVYVMDDLVLPLLSLCQALVFQAWRRTPQDR
jgi:hypothetical protein